MTDRQIEEIRELLIAHQERSEREFRERERAYNERIRNAHRTAKTWREALLKQSDRLEEEGKRDGFDDWVEAARILRSSVEDYDRINRAARPKIKKIEQQMSELRQELADIELQVAQDAAKAIAAKLPPNLQHFMNDFGAVDSTPSSFLDW